MSLTGSSALPVRLRRCETWLLRRSRPPAFGHNRSTIRSAGGMLASIPACRTRCCFLSHSGIPARSLPMLTRAARVRGVVHCMAAVAGSRCPARHITDERPGHRHRRLPGRCVGLLWQCHLPDAKHRPTGGERDSIRPGVLPVCLLQSLAVLVPHRSAAALDAGAVQQSQLAGETSLGHEEPAATAEAARRVHGECGEAVSQQRRHEPGGHACLRPHRVSEPSARLGRSGADPQFSGQSPVLDQGSSARQP